MLRTLLVLQRVSLVLTQGAIMESFTSAVGVISEAQDPAARHGRWFNSRVPSVHFFYACHDADIRSPSR